MSRSLIGRGVDLEAVDGCLAAHRLVTVVGPGGVGKTRLADAAAERARDRFAGAVHRVDLTRVDAPDAVEGVFAAQLGFDSWESLLIAPNDLPALVVVDNCEHLLDAAAGAIAGLLGSCDQPTVLATSRSPLELPDEVVVPLAPLPVPPPGHPDPASVPAVRLFLETAAAAGAAVDEADLEVVSSLCRRLDGLPLAVELAAVRTRTMSVQEIAHHLDAGVEVLVRRHFRGERRHQSIVDTVRWSFDLLADRPAQLLLRLGVFAGPFDRSMALEVAGGSSPETFAADLDELAHASLVAVDTSGPTARFRLLDTVRRFALDRLEESGAAEATMDRFVDVVVERTRSAQHGGARAWRPSMIRDVLERFDDVAEAVRWANSHDATPDRAMRLCALLWVVVHQGRAPDVVIVTSQTLERWDGHAHRLRPVVLATMATAEYVSGHHERAIALAEPTLEGVGEEGPAAVTLRRVLAQARTALGDLDGGLALFQRAAEIARRQDLLALALELEVASAQLRHAAGERDVALRDLRATCEETATSGSEVNDVWARTVLGWLLLTHDPTEAERIIVTALAHARRIEYPIAISGNLRSLAYAALVRGDPEDARAVLSELLDELVRRGAFRADGRLLVDAAAALAHAVGHPDAERLAATARTLPFATILAVPGAGPLEVPAGGAEPFLATEAVRAVKAVLEHHGGSAAGPPLDREAPTDPALVVDGDVCRISFEGHEVTLRASKGLGDLARLLAQPGREIHCLDLVGAAVEEHSTGEVVDAEARRRYEQRLRDLQDDISEAERRSDLASLQTAQDEFDAIVEHLTKALGVGGRSRSGGGTAERARSAVTQRIRTTIRRLEPVHPALARHLRASVATGTWCAYRPEREVTWTVVVPA